MKLLRTAMDIANYKTAHRVKSKLPAPAVQINERLFAEFESVSALIEKRDLA